MQKDKYKEEIEQKLRSSKVEDILLWIKKSALRLGAKVVYSCLLLFYAFKRKDTPGWAKRNILAAIAYALAPLDLIPDLSPFFGLQDDIGVLGFCLVSVACYINEDVRNTAKGKLNEWFGEVPAEVLQQVDQKL